MLTLKVSLAQGRWAQDLAAELAESMPDVVLAVLPACSEWALLSAKRSVFDRERFELSRVVFRSMADDDAAGGHGRMRITNRF